jgi:hypothetical protein
MQDDFDDGETGLPDEVGGGAELPDMETGGEADVEIDLDSAMAPAGRPSGGARAVSKKSASGGRKSQPAAKKAAAKPARKAAKKPGKPKKAKMAARKTAKKAARKGARKKGRRR